MVKLLTLGCATGHRIGFRSTMFPYSPFNFLLAILKCDLQIAWFFFVYLSFFLEMSGKTYFIIVELEDILKQHSLRLYIRHRSWWRQKPDVVIPRFYVTSPCMYTTLKNCLHENYEPGYHLEILKFFLPTNDWVTHCTAHNTHHSLKHFLPQHCWTYNDVFLLTNSTKF